MLPTPTGQMIFFSSIQEIFQILVLKLKVLIFLRKYKYQYSNTFSKLFHTRDLYGNTCKIIERSNVCENITKRIVVSQRITFRDSWYIHALGYSNLPPHCRQRGIFFLSFLGEKNFTQQFHRLHTGGKGSTTLRN